MESLLSQTLADWELIVCDSHSDDGAWEYFQKFKGDPRIRLFQVPREGLFAGWNECLKRVTGKYVYIATSDDTAYPDALGKLSGILEKHPSAGDAVGQFDFINNKGEIVPPTQGLPAAFFEEWQQLPHFRNGWVDFLVHTMIGTSWTSITSALFRADIVKKAGPFRTDVGRDESFTDRFWAMKVASFANTVSIPDKVATWRVHPEQASKGEATGWRLKNLRMTEETLRECQERIPEQWKRDPRWMETLLFGMRQYYLQDFGLDRATLKADARRFLGGAGRALMQEPAYLARRLASGLSWNTADMRNVHEVVRELIQDWKVPWPPKPLESGC